MEQPPPLTPEEIAARQTAEYANTAQPQTVKIFGILHLVFAGFGFLGLVWTVVLLTVGNPVFFLMPKTPEIVAQAKAEETLQSQMMTATVVSSLLTLVIGIIMLYAGILLLKKRRSGLKWSNRYAWTSLAGKVVNLVIAFAFTIPTMRGSMPSSGPGLPTGAPELIMIGSMVFVILISCIYPILTLVLLNRPNTKAWFASQAE